MRTNHPSILNGPSSTRLDYTRRKEKVAQGKLRVNKYMYELELSYNVWGGWLCGGPIQRTLSSGVCVIQEQKKKT